MVTMVTYVRRMVRVGIKALALLLSVGLAVEEVVEVVGGTGSMVLQLFVSHLERKSLKKNKQKISLTRNSQHGL